MNEIIKSRVLELRTEDGTIVPIILSISAPRVVLRNDEGEQWECTIQIETPSSKNIMNSYGVDSLQALIFAMDTLRGQVNSLKAEHGDNLTHLGMHDLWRPGPSPFSQSVG